MLVELQKHPGKWAISHRGAPSKAWLSSTQSVMKAWGCEAVAGKQSDGTYTLYMEFQTNATNVGIHHQGIVLLDGQQRLAELKRSVTTYP